MQLGVLVEGAELWGDLAEQLHQADQVQVDVLDQLDVGEVGSLVAAVTQLGKAVGQTEWAEGGNDKEGLTYRAGTIRLLGREVNRDVLFYSQVA